MKTSAEIIPNEVKKSGINNIYLQPPGNKILPHPICISLSSANTKQKKDVAKKAGF